jgi:hypothetical protein
MRKWSVDECDVLLYQTVGALILSIFFARTSCGLLLARRAREKDIKKEQKEVPVAVESQE